LTESWDALSTSSNNHMMLGHLMEWFYAGLGGIYQTENSVAYNEIIIAPKPVGDIKWVKCSFNSPKGMIQSDWKKEGKSFVLIVEVPKDASAKIILPDEFKNSALKVIDRNSQKPMNVQVENGEIKMGSGNFEIIAIQ
ncbi:MAG TPA: alpha-L-rhamnosidase C-terminal domain-containing protein, partial [Draconibacterium sp.]|nr:alpha-L-rhamnosidase C-terminal domain-containing protein [Draconibacterium sp.]